MNTICPRGVYALLVLPYFSLSLSSPVVASSDLDYLKVHPAELSIFRSEQLPELVLSNPHAQAYLQMYTATGKTHTSAMLGRGLYYFPIFERYLSAAKLPLELKYLAMVESELRTDVVSPSGAVGLWQFMPATARYYGLGITEWRDERRDPEAATAAAVAYLQDLFAEFGDWELVVAAYNCGSGYMRRAVRRAGSAQFSRVCRYLPEQTQAYLAKFYAAAYVASHFSTFQIYPKTPAALSGGTTRISVTEVHSLEAVARISHLALSKIKRLNPQFTQGAWPRNSGPCHLVLPEAAAQRYLAYFNRIPPQVEVATSELWSVSPGLLPVTEPYRILHSLVIDLGNRRPARRQYGSSPRYYSKYFLRGEA